ncbi:50S ribosomal protein L16 [Kiritimatiella glycovorans]|uniref:Large ribosomal subunit protein uL16 n=1 Tax=Kiritimatiella glycovorans TaxID=1307763 RepID=A0A0G3EJI4_9BACT|nr:50S ribosomal protein L16 [Kiritimatiella glycovorans]AKJ64950.1 50S ribosomal protein L16 [Kiritimatiella glycovorans]
MPLMPKRTKHRKVQKGSRRGVAQRGRELSFGAYGLQALDRGWITGIQIEACRVAINRSLKRKGKLWIRIFPDKPITEKPLEVRMGKGKGNVEHWVAVIKPGRMLFELDGVSESLARNAMRLAAAKLPMRTRFVHRDGHA